MRYRVQTLASLTVAVAACGYSLDEMHAIFDSAAAACIRVGQPITPFTRACLRQRNVLHDDGVSANIQQFRTCHAARGTIGMACAYLAVDTDSQGNVVAWRIHTSHEE
jgi:hypothetical protein